MSKFEEYKAQQTAMAQAWLEANAEAMAEPRDSAKGNGYEVPMLEGDDAESMDTVEAIVHTMAIEELEGGFWEASENDQSHGEDIALQNVIGEERWKGRKVIEESEIQTFERCDYNDMSDGILIDGIPFDHVASEWVERELTGQLIVDKFERHVKLQAKKRARFGLDGIVYDKAGRVRTKRVARAILKQDKLAAIESKEEQYRRKEARKAARAEKKLKQVAMMQANKAKWNQ